MQDDGRPVPGGDDEGEPDSASALFSKGDLPAATAAFHRYIASYFETTNFVYFVTQVVTNQDRVQRIAARALSEVGTAEAEPEDDAPGAAVTQLRQYSQLIYQLLVTRGVDNYLIYLSELLSTVFKARPETLRSGETVRLDYVLEHASMDDLINGLAERRVERLAYAGMTALSDNLSGSLGFDLFTTKADLARAVRVIEDRNLIVHNRGVINDTRKRRVKDPNEKRVSCCSRGSGEMSCEARTASSRRTWLLDWRSS